MRAGGLEPLSDQNHNADSIGQKETQRGQHEPQAGQGKKDRSDDDDVNRTGSDTSPTKPGLQQNTIKAQQEHNINTTGKDLPSDLKRLSDLWPSLPEKVRASILALVDANIRLYCHTGSEIGGGKPSTLQLYCQSTAGVE